MSLSLLRNFEQNKLKINIKCSHSGIEIINNSQFRFEQTKQKNKKIEKRQ